MCAAERSSAACVRLSNRLRDCRFGTQRSSLNDRTWRQAACRTFGLLLYRRGLSATVTNWTGFALWLCKTTDWLESASNSIRDDLRYFTTFWRYVQAIDLSGIRLSQWLLVPYPLPRLLV